MDNSKEKNNQENSTNSNNEDQQVNQENINKKEDEKNSEIEEKINEKNDEEIEEESAEEIEEETAEEILRKETEQLRDEKLRLLAEMDNLRKRSQRDKIEYIRYGSINLARDILSPDDNLSRALDAISEKEQLSEASKNLIEGLKMVQKEFATILEKYGVKKIEALNKKFDHNFHQAVVEIESSEVEPGINIKEMQPGYTMYEKLLRPSMVGVSKKPQKKEEESIVK